MNNFHNFFLEKSNFNRKCPASHKQFKCCKYFVTVKLSISCPSSLPCTYIQTHTYIKYRYTPKHMCAHMWICANHVKNAQKFSTHISSRLPKEKSRIRLVNPIAATAMTTISQVTITWLMLFKFSRIYEAHNYPQCQRWVGRVVR